MVQPELQHITPTRNNRLYVGHKIHNIYSYLSEIQVN